MTQNGNPGAVFLGILATLGMHGVAVTLTVAIFLLIAAVGQVYWAGAAAFGAILTLFIWQLVYVIPVFLWCRRRGYREFSRGIIIAAVLTALLNGGCSLMIWGPSVL